KLFHKDKFNLKSNKSFKYFMMLLFVVIGMIFFLISSFIFKEKIDINATPLNKKISVSPTEDIQIIDWIYDKNKNEMLVTIDANNLNHIEYKDINYIAYQRSNNSKLETKKIFEEDNIYVINIKELDKEYIQIALDIAVEPKVEEQTYDNDEENNKKDEDPNEQKKSEVLDTIYTDYRKVKHQTINELKQEDMFKYVNDIDIRNANKEIKLYKKKKGIKDQEIEKIKGQIKDIKEEKVYQTEDEKLESDSQINGLELKQDELKEDKKQLKNDIKKIENKIEKRKQKFREKQVGME